MVTLGQHGVLVASKDGTYKHFTALPVEQKLVKSVVGAGDSFMGGFIYGLYHDEKIEKCVEYG